MISVTLPLKTVSEANAHTHWRIRQKRAKAQRSAAYLQLCAPVRALPEKVARFAPLIPQILAGRKARFVVLEAPLVVTLTRIAPRALDSDNLAGSQKHVRDGIADALGVDDRDPRVEWRYAQRKGKPKQYAVEVVIEAAP